MGIKHEIELLKEYINRQYKREEIILTVDEVSLLDTLSKETDIRDSIGYLNVLSILNEKNKFSIDNYLNNHLNELTIVGRERILIRLYEDILNVSKLENILNIVTVSFENYLSKEIECGNLPQNYLDAYRNFCKIDRTILKGIKEYEYIQGEYNSDVLEYNLKNVEIVSTLKFNIEKDELSNYKLTSVIGNVSDFLEILSETEFVIDGSSDIYLENILKEKIYIDVKQHLEFVMLHGILEFTFEENDKLYRSIFKRNGINEILGELREISILRESNEVNRKVAYYDSLTGLARREYFLMELEKTLIEKSSNPDSRIGGILFIDVDDFKLVNDTYGHEAGDFVLRFIGKKLEESVRGGDLVCRYAGDEFTVLCKNIREHEDLECIVNRIMSSITQNPLKLEEKELKITLSIGIAVYPEHSLNIDELLRCADLAMYRAKHSGKNTYKFFESDMKKEENIKKMIRSDLKNAVSRGELYIDYMLQYDSINDKYTGIESLMRWNHPDKGIISPMAFIEIAEQSGMIVEMGYWALEESIKHTKELERLGYGELLLGINLSDLQLRQGDILNHITGLLEKYELDGSRLLLEISERTSTWKLKGTLELLNALRSEGINVCIDDFGTGLSSLSSMHKFPLTHIKIDKTFVRNLERDSENYKIIKSLMDLSSNLEIKVIAEGVENKTEYDLLNELGCLTYQGYYIGEPISFDSVKTQLQLKNKK